MVFASVDRWFVSQSTKLTAEEAKDPAEDAEAFFSASSAKPSASSAVKSPF